MTAKSKRKSWPRRAKVKARAASAKPVRLLTEADDQLYGGIAATHVITEAVASTSITPKTCGQCHHGQMLQDKLTCMRYPPAVVVIDNQARNMWVSIGAEFPACGEFKANG